MSRENGVKKIAILLFDGVEELDAVGPWEVLAYWTRTFPEDGFEVELVTADGQAVQAAKGMTLVPHRAYDGQVDYEIFLHPGGFGTRALMRDDEHLEWMRQLRARTPLMASVCTGSLVYANAGLLRDQPATTHWGSLELLAQTDPTIEVRPQDRWVDAGDIVTSAGISAGIDMALHLVCRFSSAQRAQEVKRGIQYDPAPPV